MANIQHSVLTTTELHEPKGISTANANEVYHADGAGSGDFYLPTAHIGGYVTFDAVTPAYQHSATTSDTVVDPTFTTTHVSEFSATGTPNARLVYTGTPDRHCFMSFNCSIKQSGGANRDIELVFAINGTAKEGSRIVRTTTTGSWGSASMQWDEVLSTNDYVEVFIKSSAAVTVDFAHAYMKIVGHVE